MDSKLCILFEGHGALGTLERELACVLPLVSNKNIEFGENFRTVVAFVGFAQLVYILAVTGQMLKDTEVLLTKDALKRLVRHLVSCQGFGVSHDSLTYLTVELAVDKFVLV